MTHHQPLFYNDEHCQRLLKEAPRIFNIFIHEHEYSNEVAHIASGAFSRRERAEITQKSRFNGKARYRIVVRLKTREERQAMQIRRFARETAR